MSEWREATLGEVVDLSSGGTPSMKNSAYWGGDIPWISASSLTSLRLSRSERTVTSAAIGNGTKIAPAGSLLIVVRGMSLRTEIKIGKAARDLAFNQDVKALHVRGDIHADFLLCLLDGKKNELLSMVRSATNGTGVLPTELLTELPIVVPPKAEQRRVVAVMSAVDDQIEALEAERDALCTVYENGLGLLWLVEDGGEARQGRLGEYMGLDVRRVRVDPDTRYQIAGVLNGGQGLIRRETIEGSGTDYATLNRLTAGQAVMRKLTAWEGTLAVVPPSFDGYFASNEFPTFSLRSSLSGRYFSHVCRSPRLWHEMQNRVTGTVQRRKRLNPDQLLDVALPIPELERQQQLAGVLDAIAALQESTLHELAALRTVRSDLLSALLAQEITVDAAVAKFVKAA